MVCALHAYHLCYKYSQESYVTDTLIISSSRMRTQTLRGVKWCAQGHTAEVWQSKDLNPSSPAPSALVSLCLPPTKVCSGFATSSRAPWLNLEGGIAIVIIVTNDNNQAPAVCQALCWHFMPTNSFPLTITQEQDYYYCPRCPYEKQTLPTRTAMK